MSVMLEQAVLGWRFTILTDGFEVTKWRPTQKWAKRAIGRQLRRAE